jgi:hypothetical protein
MSRHDEHVFVPIGGRLRHLLIARRDGFSVVMHHDTTDDIDEAEWTEAVCRLAHSTIVDSGEVLLAGWAGTVYSYLALEHDGELDPLEHTLIQLEWTSGDEADSPEEEDTAAHDPYIDLARYAATTNAHYLQNIGEPLDGIALEHLAAEYEMHLRNGNSFVSYADCDHCASLVRLFVLDGAQVTVLYHGTSCPSGYGCSCGCYEELNDCLWKQLGNGSLALMDGIPDEPALPNRRQRRRTPRLRRCRR